MPGLTTIADFECRDATGSDQLVARILKPVLDSVAIVLIRAAQLIFGDELAAWTGRFLTSDWPKRIKVGNETVRAPGIGQHHVAAVEFCA